MEGLSICITAYEAQDYIEECLNSIMLQTWIRQNNNWEILVGIDGCPKTLEKLRKIATRYKNLRVLMMSSNEGTYITSNTIMKEAKYNHLLRFDSDDTMKRNMLDVLWKNRNRGDILTFGFVNFGNDTSTHFEGAHGVIFMKKALFDKYGGYQPWRCSGDSEWLKRMEHMAHIINIREILFNRRVHSQSLTQKKGALHLSHGSQRLQYRQYIKHLNVRTVKSATIICKTNTFKEIMLGETEEVMIEKKPERVLVCCIAKLENNYIEEWARHYLEIGVDKIVIYDNNNSEGEYAEKILDVPYIAKKAEEGKIDVIARPDQIKIQRQCYNECYKKYGSTYDWLMFFDVDEFLEFEKYKDVHDYLKQDKFDAYEIIHVNWKIYDDNGLIKVENGDYSLQKRFTRELAVHCPKKAHLNKELKSIVRGGLSNIEFTKHPHSVTSRYLKCCNANGGEGNYSQQSTKTPSYKGAWLKHYITKTIEEYTEIKAKRGGGVSQTGRYNFNFFFIYNDRTKEKLAFLKSKGITDMRKEVLLTKKDRIKLNTSTTNQQPPKVITPIVKRIVKTDKTISKLYRNKTSENMIY